MAKEIRLLDHHPWLHVHNDSESRDCDGRYASGYTTWLALLVEGFIPDDPEADDLFRAMMIYWEAHDGTEMVFGVLDDGRDFVRYHQYTDEGYRSGQLLFCEKPDCMVDDESWQRDYSAEAAGY